LAQLAPAPRRTIRGVLFMNEENGTKGGDAYAEAHKAEHHVAAMEIDSGHYRPTGLKVHAGEGGLKLFAPWMPFLTSLDAAELSESDGGGADLTKLDELSGPIPNLSMKQDNGRYFDIHHSAGDTLDKVHPADLARLAAAVAWTVYAAAEMPETLPRPAKALAAPKSAVMNDKPAGASTSTPH
ncbi:MAG: peptidase M28 family protein, partial [Deltaproteobacteria bacterium]|nr:peptidase M28 family protein [Deltaproteobacteria bacterium]